MIAASALLGLQILEFFGISLASFQVGGGMLLLISSMNMLNAQPAEAKPHTHELDDGRAEGRDGRQHRRGAADDPAAHGPATMSTVVIYAEQAQTLLQMAALVGYGVVIGWRPRCAFRWPIPSRACWARPAST